MTMYLLVELQPCRITLAVGILESKEPDFAETDCLDNLVKQLFARCRRLDGKFQLGVHRRHPNIDLHSFKDKKRKKKICELALTTKMLQPFIRVS